MFIIIVDPILDKANFLFLKFILQFSLFIVYFPFIDEKLKFIFSY